MRILIGLLLLGMATSANAAIVWTCTRNFQAVFGAGYLIAGTCVSDTGAATGAAGDPLAWSAVCGSSSRVAKSVIFSTPIANAGATAVTAHYNVGAQTLQLAVAQAVPGATVQHVAYTGTPATAMTTSYIAVCQ